MDELESESKKSFTAKIAKKGRKECKEMPDDVCFPVYVLAKDCGEVTEYPTVITVQYDMEAIDVERVGMSFGCRLRHPGQHGYALPG